MNRHSSVAAVNDRVGIQIRVRGRVQGVGFRPTVWRYARELGLSGNVFNDADGVLIHVYGSDIAITALISRLQLEPPSLARIDAIETQPCAAEPSDGFVIAESVGGDVHTQIAPDTAICLAYELRSSSLRINSDRIVFT